MWGCIHQHRRKGAGGRCARCSQQRARANLDSLMNCTSTVSKMIGVAGQAFLSTGSTLSTTDFLAANMTSNLHDQCLNTHSPRMPSPGGGDTCLGSYVSWCHLNHGNSRQVQSRLHENRLSANLHWTVEPLVSVKGQSSGSISGQVSTPMNLQVWQMSSS